ncbi:MAG: ribonuclease Y [Candidatus Firestonebacteria bacterium]|nr:ribonuclease Y [Candidatus Firestonebacteria bacterium]
MFNIGSIIVFILIFIIGNAVGFFLRKIMAENKVMTAEKMSKKIIEEAEKEASTQKKQAILEAKEELYKDRANFERENKERRIELINLEKRLLQKEENLDRKVELLEKKEKEISSRLDSVNAREKNLEKKDIQLRQMIEDQKTKLEAISGITAEEAKKILMDTMQSEARHDAAIMIKQIEMEARETADKKAKEILSLAIQRCAAEHVVDTTVSVITLPNEEMKGRIIGREGRNIRAFENSTGVNLIIDDTPEAVILSGFDSIRREIARISLEKLISDGRIHPARIEELVEKTKKEMEELICELGEQASFEVGVHGLHAEEIRLLGKLKYRTSYGQNVLQHSKEVAHLAGIMISELGITGDVQAAKRAGLLHDIGKALNYENEGTHTHLGVELAKKYNENPKIIHAIAAHHNDEEPKTVLAVLIQAADAISAARPGARRETLENYIKRLEKLEKIADSFKGVEKSYAIQAGRELRIIVESDEVDDALASQLAKEISGKIEQELEYPGQIKVTVIRETRAIEYAK